MHNELAVECSEEQAEEVARFVEEAIVAGIDEVLNPGLKPISRSGIRRGRPQDSRRLERLTIRTSNLGKGTGGSRECVV